MPGLRTSNESLLRWRSRFIGSGQFDEAFGSHVSGGPLELSKHSCHILQWQFSIQGAPVSVQKLSEGIAQIKVWDTQKNTKHRLQTLGAFHAHKTLGHIKDPAGTQGEQFRQLLKKNYDITAFCGSAPSHASRHGLTTMRVTFRLLDIHWPVASSLSENNSTPSNAGPCPLLSLAAVLIETRSEKSCMARCTSGAQASAPSMSSEELTRQYSF